MTIPSSTTIHLVFLLNPIVDGYAFGDTRTLVGRPGP
jgi:hypothetical protein